MAELPVAATDDAELPVVAATDAELTAVPASLAGESVAVSSSSSSSSSLSKKKKHVVLHLTLQEAEDAKKKAAAQRDLELERKDICPVVAAHSTDIAKLKTALAEMQTTEDFQARKEAANERRRTRQREAGREKAALVRAHKKPATTVDPDETEEESAYEDSSSQKSDSSEDSESEKKAPKTTKKPKNKPTQPEEKKEEGVVVSSDTPKKKKPTTTKRALFLTPVSKNNKSRESLTPEQKFEELFKTTDDHAERITLAEHNNILDFEMQNKGKMWREEAGKCAWCGIPLANKQQKACTKLECQRARNNNKQLQKRKRDNAILAAHKKPQLGQK